MHFTKVFKFNSISTIILLLGGCWLIGQSTYIHAKAWLAQTLIEDAWIKISHGQPQTKPWPWADTWPVARLRVPRLNIDLFVLAGDSARNLAFGPGHNFASPKPGSTGNSIISAHRDTHFSFLKHLQKDDEVIIETTDTRKRFSVYSTQVVHRDRASFPADELNAQIHLVTCYPFDTMITGGPERYIVSAHEKRNI